MLLPLRLFLPTLQSLHKKLKTIHWLIKYHAALPFIVKLQAGAQDLLMISRHDFKSITTSATNFGLITQQPRNNTTVLALRELTCAIYIYKEFAAIIQSYLRNPRHFSYSLRNPAAACAVRLSTSDKV